LIKKKDVLVVKKKKRDSLSSSNVQEIFNEIFNFKDEIVIDSFNCLRKTKILILGKMFITKNHICFFSHIFKNSQVIIPIKFIQKFNLVGLIKNEFKIYTKKEDKNLFAKLNLLDKYSFVFVSVFNAPKHLKFMENLIKAKKIPFNTSVVFTTDKKMPKINKNNTKNIESHQFEILKDIDLEIILTKEFPISCSQLFKATFSDNATYSLLDFYDDEGGFSNIKCSEWLKQETHKSRKISFEFELKGVPFMMKSFASNIKVIRSEKLIESDAKYSILATIITPEITYGNYFEIYHLYIINKKLSNSLVKVKYGIKFKKQIPFLQNKIAKKSFDDNTKSLIKYFSELEKKLSLKVNGEEKKMIKLKKIKQDKINLTKIFILTICVFILLIILF